jgi:hypothetical protein
MVLRGHDLRPRLLHRRHLWSAYSSFLLLIRQLSALFLLDFALHMHLLNYFFVPVPICTSLAPQVLSYCNLVSVLTFGLDGSTAHSVLLLYTKPCFYAKAGFLTIG